MYMKDKKRLSICVPFKVDHGSCCECVSQSDGENVDGDDRRVSDWGIRLHLQGPKE